LDIFLVTNRGPGLDASSGRNSATILNEFTFHVYLVFSKICESRKQATTQVLLTEAVSCVKKAFVKVKLKLEANRYTYLLPFCLYIDEYIYIYIYYIDK